MSMKKLFFSLIVLFALTACSEKNISVFDTQVNFEGGNIPIEITDTSYQAILGSGYFISGVDFPAGKYDIKAVNGAGRIDSSNRLEGGVGGLIGYEEERYEPSYTDVDLSEGVALYLFEVSVEITSSNLYNSSLKGREQPNTQTISLGEGKYKAGKDFPIGVYDVVAIRGAGHVEHGQGGLADFSLGLVFISPEDHSMSKYSQPVYKNVTFKAGDTIKVSSDIEIHLIPSR